MVIYGYIAYFPDDDYRDKGQEAKAYGPFAREEEARAYARTLSTDPDEGVIRTLVRPQSAECNHDYDNDDKGTISCIKCGLLHPWGSGNND